MENFETNKEASEKKYKYTYREYSTRNIVFECVTTNIIEADKMYREATGKNPEKQNNIGCSIEEVKDSN